MLYSSLMESMTYLHSSKWREPSTAKSMETSLAPMHRILNPSIRIQTKILYCYPRMISIWVMPATIAWIVVSRATLIGKRAARGSGFRWLTRSTPDRSIRILGRRFALYR